MSTNHQMAIAKRKGHHLQRFLTNIHIGLYRRTNGSIGGRLAGRPMLLLLTVGRKSGQERTTAIMYTRDGNDYILIASNGGAPQDPQWFRNLAENAHARIQVGAQIIEVTARKANVAERSRLWLAVTSQYQNFADYQTRTTREIPVVILTPNVSVS
ncbi:MAG: nitroreductase family deazaflavin-dependent oxidoreductase [Ktedonobacteraceae bacterium]